MPRRPQALGLPQVLLGRHQETGIGRSSEGRHSCLLAEETSCSGLVNQIRNERRASPNHKKSIRIVDLGCRLDKKWMPNALRVAGEAIEAAETGLHGPVNTDFFVESS